MEADGTRAALAAVLLGLVLAASLILIGRVGLVAVSGITPTAPAVGSSYDVIDVPIGLAGAIEESERRRAVQPRPTPQIPAAPDDDTLVAGADFSDGGAVSTSTPGTSGGGDASGDRPRRRSPGATPDQPDPGPTSPADRDGGDRGEGGGMREPGRGAGSPGGKGGDEDEPKTSKGKSAGTASHGGTKRSAAKPDKVTPSDRDDHGRPPVRSRDRERPARDAKTVKQRKDGVSEDKPDARGEGRSPDRAGDRSPGRLHDVRDKRVERPRGSAT